VSKEEIRQLYETFGPAIHRRALALLGREADAWDAMQEVFEKILRSGGAFRGEARPMTYIYRVTTNVCLNMLRQRRSRDPVEPLPAAEESAAEPRSVEAANLIRVLMSDLPERAREVAVLHFMDELSQEEIAEVLGTSRKTVQRDLDIIREKAAALGEPGAMKHG
jgi:RNA polymerase sigma-70 factor (ECF subfamily)